VDDYLRTHLGQPEAIALAFVPANRAPHILYGGGSIEGEKTTGNQAWRRARRVGDHSTHGEMRMEAGWTYGSIDHIGHGCDSRAARSGWGGRSSLQVKSHSVL